MSNETNSLLERARKRREAKQATSETKKDSVIVKTTPKTKKKTKSHKFRGITEKKMKDGSTAIMVRFKHNSETFAPRNFTRLYGCKTITEAEEKLNQVKISLSKGVNPFKHTPYTLNEIWEARIEIKRTANEWKEITIGTYKMYYNTHIKKYIGGKKLSKITYTDLTSLLARMSDKQGGTKNTIKKILYPIFDEAVKHGLLNENITLKLDSYKSGNDKSIDLRTEEPNLSIVRKLYNAIPHYKVHQKSQEQEIKTYLFLLILTSHRKHELLKLTKDDVYLSENKIVCLPSITKMSDTHKFPIPPECLSYIKSIKSGLLFPTLKYPSLYNIFQRLVKMTDIKFDKGKTLSPHDMRRIQLSVMTADCGIDSRISDFSIGHKQVGAIKYYISFSYKDIQKAYHQYWDKILLPDNEYDEKYNNLVKEVIPKTPKISNHEILKNYHEMFKDGLLTAEEFITQKKALL